MTEGCAPGKCCVNPRCCVELGCGPSCPPAIISTCGNGQIESGENCGEPGLKCYPGQICNQCTCVQLNSCGNGILEIGEECDDKNKVDGDGCSATCKFEAGDVEVYV